MYYSKTAALDKHVNELTKIIRLIEPKALQLPGQEKCKISERELKNRIEQLVLMAYTLRRKTTNEPFVPATEQEWAHLYMDGACAKKYYSCQGRQVYVPRKVAENPCKISNQNEYYIYITTLEYKFQYPISLYTKKELKDILQKLNGNYDFIIVTSSIILDNFHICTDSNFKHCKKYKRYIKVENPEKGKCQKNIKNPEQELACVINRLKDEDSTKVEKYIDENFDSIY